MIKAVFFDLDGTLVNTIVDLGAAVTQIMKEQGAAVSYTDADYKLMVGNGAKRLVERAFHGAGLPMPADPTPFYNRFREIYSQTLFDHASLYDGIAELLSWLKQSGYLLAVITNKPEHHAGLMVRHMFGDNLFDFVAGQREGVAVKPDPGQVLLACSELGLSANEVVFVGDSNIDIQTARNAGAASIGVDWGFRGETELRREGADYIAYHASDIQKILQKLSKTT